MSDDDARIVVPENSPVGESQSNGTSKRTVQMVEDQIRTMRLSLEAGIGARIPCEHPLMHWLVIHSAHILNKDAVNWSGFNSYETNARPKGPREKGGTGRACLLLHSQEGPPET